ncbi:MAG: glycosyltransferase [Nitrososphaerales archaeon]
MKISILAPREIPIPLSGYGGIELLAQDLFLELIQRGHDVTIYCTPNGKSTGTWTDEFPEIRMALRPYPANKADLKEPQDLTLDFSHQKYGAPYFNEREYIAYCFLTDNQSKINDVYATKAVRAGYPGAENGKVIYPGIRNSYHYLKEKEGYLLFLGRLAMFKRPDIAIVAAQRAGKKIIVAGHGGEYARYPDPSYPVAIKQLADDNSIVLVEEPSQSKKVELLSNASALLAPSQWSIIGSKESFGIVAVEALMSGIPVITSGDGGLGEIVTPDVGFICSNMQEYVSAIKRIAEIDPEKCLERGNYFSVARFADDLLSYYKEISS